MEQDTPPENLARYHQLLRQMSPMARLQKAADLSVAVRQLALAGLRLRHPQAAPDELRARLAVRLYGRENAIRMRMVVPDDAV